MSGSLRTVEGVRREKCSRTTPTQSLQMLETVGNDFVTHFEIFLTLIQRTRGFKTCKSRTSFLKIGKVRTGAKFSLARRVFGTGVVENTARAEIRPVELINNLISEHCRADVSAKCA